MEKRSKINKFFCWVLSIILAIEIIAICLVNLASNSILKKAYIQNKLEETKFYTQIKSDIEDSFKNYVLQSNLDDECVENLITDDKIKSDVNQVLEAVYDGKKMNIETDSIKQELQNRINEKLQINKYMTLTADAKKSINDFIDIIINNYKSNMQISESTINQVGQIVQKVNNAISKYTKIAYIIIAITAIILLVIYIVGCKGKKSIINKYHAMSLMIAGSVLIISEIISKIKINADNLLIYNKAVTNLLITIVKNIQKDVLMYGIIIFAIGLIITIVENIRIRNEK